MPNTRIQFPIMGAADSSAFIDLLPGFVPPEALSNVRPYGAITKRRRGGRRAGLERAFPLRLPGPPATMIAMSKASAQTGFELGDELPFGSGYNVSFASSILGNAHVRDVNGEIRTYIGTIDAAFGFTDTSATTGVVIPLEEAHPTNTADVVPIILGSAGCVMFDYTLPGSWTNGISSIPAAADRPYSDRWVAHGGNTYLRAYATTGYGFTAYDQEFTSWCIQIVPTRATKPPETLPFPANDDYWFENPYPTVLLLPNLTLRTADALRGLIPGNESTTYVAFDDAEDRHLFDISSENKLLNSLAETDHWIVACVGNGLVFYNKGMIRTSSVDYTYWYDLKGWSNEAVKVVFEDDVEEIEGVRWRTGYCLFQGSWAAGTINGTGLSDDTIRAFRWGGHFRAGIDKFRIRDEAFRGDETFNEWKDLPVIERIGFASKLASSDPYYEANHRTFRFSEHLERAPRGCWPEDMAILSDGRLVVAFSNTGYGPNESEPEHLPNANGWRATTLALIDPAGNNGRGAVQWEVDTRSRRDAANGIPPVDGTTFVSDIPHDTGVDATLRAVCVGPGDRIYCGGNRTGGNVFCYNTAGVELWLNDVGDFVRQGAMTVDLADGNVLVGGGMNDDWVSATLNPSSNIDAHAWRLDAQDGEITAYYTLPAKARDTTKVNPSGLFDEDTPVTSVAAIGDGEFAFGHWWINGS